MSMQLAIDTETHLIEDGLVAPPLVCLTFSDGHTTDILNAADAVEFMHEMLALDTVIIGHNLPYDMGVLVAADETLLKPVFRHYELGLTIDTKIRRVLELIGQGTLAHNLNKLSLAALTKKYLGIELDKSEDSWRLRYSELEEVPLKDWPQEAVHYATADAASTWKVAQKLPRPPDEVLQNRADWALRLMGIWGIRTDPESVFELKASLEQDRADLMGKLVEHGLVRKNGSQDMKVLKTIIEEALGDDTPRNAPTTRFPQGSVKTDADTLSDIDHPALEDLVLWKQKGKVLSTYIPFLEHGTKYPITPSWNALVDTGRTSCRRPNLQNLKRSGNVRPCFVARPGYLFVSCDYSSAELVSLAQITYSWFGHSEMREAINAGRDLHLELGAQLLDISYEEALERKKNDDPEIKDMRQAAKAANFGFPGGLGPDAFLKFARGYGFKGKPRSWAVEIKQAWLKRWPEMNSYFHIIGNITGDLGPKQIEQIGSRRKRGGLRFTQAANSYFQGLTADGAKCALWEVSRLCYTVEESPLYDSRPVAFIHDEILQESPIDKAPEAGDELSKVMNEQMQIWCPDVRVTSEPSLMRKWIKGARTLRDENGRLMVDEGE